MRIFGLSVGDGQVSIVSRHSDGLHLSVMGLDPRGTDDFGSGSDIQAGALDLLVVVPSPVLLPTGEATFAFTARGYDEDGNPTAVEAVWSIVEGGTDATIDADTGILTTGALTEEEDITVRATVGSLTADADVSIQDLVLDSIVVSPAGPWNMVVGQTLQLSAIGYVGEAAVAVTPTWSVFSGGGSISTSGLFTAGTTAGAVVIRATHGVELDDVAIVVNPGTMIALRISPDNTTIEGGTTENFTVVGLDVYSNEIAISQLSEGWTCLEGGSMGGVGNPATLSASASEIEDTFVDAIRATHNGLVDYTSFTVTPGDGGPDQ